MDEIKEALTFGCLCVVVLFVLVSGLIIGANNMEMPGALSQIEQLRADMMHVSKNSEDIIGQAADWNQTIKSKQAYNKIWWSKMYIPNAWDEVEPIAIPRN